MIVDAHLHLNDIPALGWKLEAAGAVFGLASEPDEPAVDEQ